MHLSHLLVAEQLFTIKIIADIFSLAGRGATEDLLESLELKGIKAVLQRSHPAIVYIWPHSPTLEGRCLDEVRFELRELILKVRVSEIFSIIRMHRSNVSIFDVKL